LEKGEAEMMNIKLRMGLGVLFIAMFLFMAICLTEVVIHNACHENKWFNIVVILGLLGLVVKEIREMRFIWKNREIWK